MGNVVREVAQPVSEYEPMKIYYDFEFLEDGKTIDTISIGMLREDGKEYYAVNAGVVWLRVWRHEWLRANVIPHLPTYESQLMGQPYRALDRTHPEVKPKAQIAEEVSEFFFDTAKLSGEVELWGWYSAYDHVALAQLFGPMIDRPMFMPMYTNDIRQEFQRLGNPAHNMPEANHNALADAHYHKKLHEFIMNYEKELNAKG